MGAAFANLRSVSNVSLLHEAPLDVLRDAPATVVELLRLAPGSTVLSFGAADLQAIVIDSELTEAVPLARRADLVVELSDDSEGLRQLVVVEVQRDADPEKLYAWPLYVAHLHARHRVPVTLLVLTFDDSVAAWARTPRDIGASLVLRAIAMGPSDLPAIASIEDAIAQPALGVLRAISRIGARDRAPDASDEAEVCRVVKAILRAHDRRRVELYLPLLNALASSELRATIDQLLEERHMGRALDMIFAEERAKARDEGRLDGVRQGRAEGVREGRAEGVREGRAEGVREGRAEGTLEGEARALLRVLGRRGIIVDTETEARILATRDLEVLGRWLDRAVDAKTLADVLDS